VSPEKKFELLLADVDNSIIKKQWMFMLIWIFLLILAIQRVSVAVVSYPAHEFCHITTEDGLPGCAVYSIIQDPDGFMWFGTNSGMVRYDGYDFKVWRHDPADSTSIINDNVGHLFMDSRGGIWIGTWGGRYQPLRPRNRYIPQFQASCRRTSQFKFQSGPVIL